MASRGGSTPSRDDAPLTPPREGSDPSANASATVRQMLDAHWRAGNSPHDTLEALGHLRSKERGAELARERGEAVPPADDEEGRE